MMMKALVCLVVIVFIGVQSQTKIQYTRWDNWHNVPFPYNSTKLNINSNPNLTNWVRNTPSNTHYSGYFGNFSNIYSQNLYWRKQDPNQINFCKPKYYLWNDTACRKNPYYWGTVDAEFCTPNTFGQDQRQQYCDMNNDFYRMYNRTCCFNDLYMTSLSLFQSNFWSVDKYPVPIM